MAQEPALARKNAESGRLSSDLVSCFLQSLLKIRQECSKPEQRAGIESSDHEWEQVLYCFPIRIKCPELIPLRTVYRSREMTALRRIRWKTVHATCRAEPGKPRVPGPASADAHLRDRRKLFEEIVCQI